MVRVTTLFDNYMYRDDLESLWGFSCLIELRDQTLLFDTGSNGRVLLRNMKALDIDVSRIDTLFLSHHHWDHTGGLDSVTELNPHLQIVAPKTISKRWLQDLRSQSEKVTVVECDALAIGERCFSTGMLGEETPEQALIADTPKGLMIVTGCAHSGIVAIVEKACQLFQKEEIALLMGGFHLMHTKTETIQEVISVLKRYPIKHICPTHCSGDEAISMIKNQMPSQYLQGGVGAVISIE